MSASRVTTEVGADSALPGLLVYSSLFPSSTQPTAGIFIRERMFRLRPRAGMVVVAPQPWFPGQSLIRRFRPGYRPPQPSVEEQQGTTVYFPRFIAAPGILRRLDGWSMALCTLPLVRRLCRDAKLDVIDAHFAYPCGQAAVLLGRWLRRPVSVTLRGTETRHLSTPSLRAGALQAVREATRVFSVSDSLRQLFIAQGVSPDQIEVVGNGVDLDRFRRLPQPQARTAIGLPSDVPVLISVGGLVPRKGFHRVIALLPSLRRRFPGLRYLVIGGPGPEGDMEAQLRDQVTSLGLGEAVIFTGPVAPDRLATYLSAADVFVLATANEGWANVFLEAMACGLPVVTTNVGGNAEVVCGKHLGCIVPFGDEAALEQALDQSLTTDWDRDRIVAHARANTWDDRLAQLARGFRRMVQMGPR